jgi:hypothetical protein
MDPAIGRTQQKQPQKPTKAPWEDEDFIEMIKQSSDPVFPLEAHIQDSSDTTSNSAIPSDEQDQPFMVKEEVHEVSFEDRYTDTIVSTKVFIGLCFSWHVLLIPGLARFELQWRRSSNTRGYYD